MTKNTNQITTIIDIAQVKRNYQSLSLLEKAKIEITSFFLALKWKIEELLS